MNRVHKTHSVINKRIHLVRGMLRVKYQIHLTLKKKLIDLTSQTPFLKSKLVRKALQNKM